MANVKFDVQLDDGAKMPVRAHDTDVGYDVCANEVEFVYAHKTWWQRLFNIEPRIITVKCNTGVHLTPIGKTSWVMGVPNSRVSKQPFVLGNSCGIIDPDYTGSIRYIYNVLPQGSTKEMNKIVKEYFVKGAVVGQLIVVSRYGMTINKVEQLEETDRGDGGFGSTAK